MRFAIVCLALAACTPSPNPSPMPPDASDASVSQCAAVCSMLPASCQVADCAATLAKIQSGRLVKNPTTGQPLTCADQLTPDVLKALGWCQ